MDLDHFTFRFVTSKEFKALAIHMHVRQSVLGDQSTSFWDNDTAWTEAVAGRQLVVPLVEIPFRNPDLAN